MLISDKLQRFESILTLQGKPNHTTYGHSRSPTWQPFTSSHRSCHRRIPPKDTILELTCAQLRAGRFQHDHSPCPQRGGSPSSKAYSASNLVILQVTSVYLGP